MTQNGRRSALVARRQVQGGSNIVPVGRYQAPVTLSPPVEEAPPSTSPKPFLLKGFVVIGLMVFGFGGWAATAPLDSAAVAPGSIIVDGGRQKIQHLEGGTILEMLVRDGDRVEQGQVLLRLDPTQAQASRSIVESNYIAAKAQESRLLAELREQTEITFDQELAALSDRPDVRQVLDVQRDLFESRSSLRRQQLEVLGKQIAQLNDEIGALQAQKASNERQIALVSEELEGLRTLLAEGLTVKTQVLELERNHEALKGETASLEATIAKTNNQISEVEEKIALERSNVQDQLNEELKEAQLAALQAREELVGASDILERVAVRAPVDGVIANNSQVTVGGVVGPGELIMEVVPTTRQLVIDARVSILDVDSIKIGQEANVMLTAFNQATTPVLHGRVDHVAADRQVDEATNEPFFQAKVIVPDDQLQRLDDGQELKPGMPADAIIVTGERTVLDYLTKPITQILARSWREE